MLSRTLLASLLSVSALGAMPSDAGVVFASSSPGAHRATHSSARAGAAADHHAFLAHRAHHREHAHH